jgi:hypothetical protein
MLLFAWDGYEPSDKKREYRKTFIERLHVWCSRAPPWILQSTLKQYAMHVRLEYTKKFIERSARM